MAFVLLAVPGIASGDARSERVIGQIEQLVVGQRGMRVYDWVGFTLQGAAVTLQGSVTSPALKQSIERSILALESVDTVRNGLEVLPNDGDDIGIRVNAYWRIYGHPEIRRFVGDEGAFRPRLRRSAEDVQRVLLKPIHIVVRNRELILEGEVEQRRQKRVAELQANAVRGVRAVANNLVVTGTDTEEFEPIDFEADPWWADSNSVPEPVLRVENPVGGIRIAILDTDRVRVRRTCRSRPIRPLDTKTTRLGRKTRIRAQPPDGAAIDLEIDLPYGHRVEAETVDGPISLTGLVRQARLQTAIGRVELEVPWRGVRLEAVSDRRPLHLSIPNRLRSSLRVPAHEIAGSVWTLQDTRDARSKLYGSIRLEATHPDALVLREGDVAEDSPIRMHWQAKDALGNMLRRRYRMRLERPAGEDGPPSRTEEGLDSGMVQFNSDVRLVQLSATVVDRSGRPVPGLESDDFQILEDDVEQSIRMVRDTDAEFNLVLLLDCSTSTLVDREAVLEAARRFVLTARPGDRVAIHVLSDAYVHVVSRLTDDQDALLDTIERIPRLSGGTPLYDAITLAYADELASRRWERNALIVISDGMDNEFLPRWSRSVPSEVPFDELLRVAAEINSAIYPIFLEPDEPGIRTERRWREQQERAAQRARARMGQLAEVTGGRLFAAGSIRDLDDVYEQVAGELRSVYTLGYYPANQDFDGAWRRVRVRLEDIDARVRTRPGYYGW